MSGARAPRQLGGAQPQALLYRRWLIGAALAGAESDGIGSLSVARVIAQAGVSRKAFYDVFADVEACAHAALEETFASARGALEGAYRSEEGWLAGTRAALHTLLALAERRRALARVCIVDTLAAGPRLLALREHAMDEAREALDRGALEARARRPAPLTAEAIAGGIAELLHARLLTGERTPLTELTGQCMSIIVLPYLGPVAAAKELARVSASASDLEHLLPRAVVKPITGGPRLTYRTLRVLSVIAEQPGASNRQVARAAEIADQGQVSKLLKRLAARDLIENTSTEASGNAWQLTALGRGFHASVSPGLVR